MKRKIISVIIANLFAAGTAAYAAEGMQLTGSASLGLQIVNDRARDPSKLMEYRDLDSNVLNAFDVRMDGDTYHLNGFAEGLGTDDTYFTLRGGQYGRFKYQVNGTTLRHNFGSGDGARTPFSGAGTTTLTGTFPSLNAATWNTFDNSYKREDFGGFFEWSANNPWYFRTDANQVTRKGIKVIASSLGASPGNGAIDLPVPVDFKTNNFGLEAGFQTRDQHYSVRFDQAKFSNENELIRWINPYRGSGLDFATREPDNDYWKLAFNGVVKRLPMNSTLGGRLTYSKLTNSVNVLTSVLDSTAGAFIATSPNTGTFNGDIRNTTASLTLSSSPMDKLDTRAYWNWTRKENQSTQMVFSTANLGGNTIDCGTLAGSGRNCVPALFNYRKNNLGAEAGYKLNADNKLSGGVDYYDTLRERYDSKNTTDWKYFVELKNHTLETVSAKVKYHYLTRRSSVDGWDIINPIDQYVRRFDVADVDQHAVKLVVDVAPAIPHLDIGLEATFKDNEYKKTRLGRTDDARQEYFASIAYGDPKAFRMMVFGDIEFAQYDSQHRVGTGTANPDAAPTSSTYNWRSKIQDRSWQLGIGADWLPTERLKVHSSFIHMQTRGLVDFNTEVGTPPQINNSDNTRRTSINLKGTYRLDKQWSMTAGYAWEKYRFNDIGYNGYQYVIGSGTTATYLSGINAFQNYTANIVYVAATYKFQ